MTQNQIFILPVRGQKRFFGKRPLISDISQKEIVDFFGVMVRCYSKGFESQIFVCSQEEAKLIKNGDPSIHPKFSPSLYDYYDLAIVNIANVVPKGGYLFTNTTPQLRTSRGGLDSFDFADRQQGNEVVEDKTIYSGKIAFKNASDYDSLEHRDAVLLSIDQEKELFANHPEEYLKSLQFAGEQAAIEFKKTNLLEEK